MKVAALSLALTALLTLAACSKPDTPASAPAAPAPTTAVTTSSYDAAASKGKGFSVGALMSAQTVYVIFEPQCPHCGRLWQASLPLHNKVKFVWMPVSFNAKSLPQAAA
ncbi:MAG: DsbC family protein, partial [Rhodoferax sp.]|nr:DsbC family protein [Rhodoferax sp.]